MKDLVVIHSCHTDHQVPYFLAGTLLQSGGENVSS
jgi:hypothetical protein